MSIPTKDQALKALIDCIECTGGCVVDDHGNVVPYADQEWIDLGDAYMAACAALNVEPKFEES
jgi:hypothetical protein